MNDKFTQLRPNMQVRRLPAGILPGDSKTELFGDIKTRKVYGIRKEVDQPLADATTRKASMEYIEVKASTNA